MTAVAGCGAAEPRAPIAPPVSASQVRDAGGLRTPKGAVFRAWRAVQRDDAATLHASFAPDAVTRRAIVKMLHGLSPLIPKGTLIVRRVTQRGHRARIDALIRLVALRAEQDTVTEIETTFALRKVGHQWRLVDTGFLTDRVRRVENRGRTGAR
ncbi:MAG TPA: hypothetical protein VGW75_01165 [Solirubrobacteraceae bacterium]|jgi:ketosteroid isomerase-like protein|nr:hypothetical protein [Solirubrobacteraceae bacterium]